MKKNPRKELSLSKTTVRSLVRAVDAHQLEQVGGGLYNLSIGCYTKPAGGCP